MAYMRLAVATVGECGVEREPIGGGGDIDVDPPRAELEPEATGPPDIGRTGGNVAEELILRLTTTGRTFGLELVLVAAGANDTVAARGGTACLRVVAWTAAIEIRRLVWCFAFSNNVCGRPALRRINRKRNDASGRVGKRRIGGRANCPRRREKRRRWPDQARTRRMGSVSERKRNTRRRWRRREHRDVEEQDTVQGFRWSKNEGRTTELRRRTTSRKTLVQ